MMIWNDYPADYRLSEVQAILTAVQAGECVSIIGLSGAGKSNLLGFLANRMNTPDGTTRFILVDCNRLASSTPETFYRLVRQALGNQARAEDEFQALESAIDRLLSGPPHNLCLLLDRFENLTAPAGSDHPAGGRLAGNLRALRDSHKYALTYVITTRRPLDPHSELAELFYANTLWLGPLGESDARWNITRYARRRNKAWDEAAIQSILNVTRGYPSFLKAVCEAYTAGASLEATTLIAHPAVAQRLEEFWADHPTPEDLRSSGIEDHPLLVTSQLRTISLEEVNAVQLTAKEHLLLAYLRQHPGVVCEKDDLMRAVWSEDKVFERGMRDDSLAQLVRRLREKIEADASRPVHIHTVAGRGYRFTP